MHVYVRADDRRFDAGYATINNPDVRIISADGQMSSAVARTEFPKARLMELPNMTPLSQQVEEVATGKADVFMSEAAAAELYMKANPGKVRRLPAAAPLRIFQNTLAMEIGEERLKTMLDSALIDIIENGELDRILRKYDSAGTMFLKPAAGYRP
jgi:ABC-type amino acid transport substrate-binding protein